MRTSLFQMEINCTCEVRGVMLPTFNIFTRWTNQFDCDKITWIRPVGGDGQTSLFFLNFRGGLAN